MQMTGRIDWEKQFAEGKNAGTSAAAKKGKA